MTTTDSNPTSGVDGELPVHLTGNWAPVFEEITATDLPVAGAIPEELDGSYIRAGMNPQSGHSDHWFFGNGMMHGIQLSGGKARTYRNRYVRTPYYDEDMDVFSAMADPRNSPANTNVVPYAGKILALEEAHWPWEITADLSTVGPVSFDDQISSPMTAHPKFCPETGEMVFFGYQFMSEPYLTYYVADGAGSLTHKAAIDLPGPVMMHDFSITRNYSIIMDLPMQFALEKGGFHFNREAPSRLGVLPRHGGNGEVRWFDINTCFVFHPLNSYEVGNTIILDVARFEEIWSDGMDGQGQAPPNLWRWTIDLDAGTVTEEQLDDRGCDFSRVDDRRAGLEHRYGYFLQLPHTPQQEFGSELYKYDLEKNTCDVHHLGDGVKGGEGLFVPRHADSAEDDGFVVLYAHDENTDQSHFRIIDAQDFAGPPLAEVALPQRIPYGPHGNWFDATTYPL